MSVILYTTPTCGFCHQLKNYLGQRGVAYTEFDVSRNRDAAVEMVRISGQQGVPVLVVDGQVVVGFDRPRIDRLLAQSVPRLGAAIADATRFAARKGLDLPAGAYVGRVDGGSVASRAGLEVGDVITSLDGRPVITDRDVDRILTTIDRGQVAPAVVWRRGQTLSLTLRF
jgi:glutaredoxin-like YruB-family protein